jgi:4-amino-4-deoxy-L-arabinose transferase-like glycosyltransferase
MGESERGRPLLKDRVALLWAGVALVAHLAVANRYGLFRDELYFIVCGRHPAFGYADQPPLVPLIAAGAYALGHQLWVVRAVPALAAAAAVLVAVALARLAGGKDGAAHVAGATVATAPFLLAIDGTLNTTAFDAAIWTGLSLLFARAALLDDRRAPIWAGVLAGVGLEVKYFVVVWALALLVGCALTSWRRVLARPEVALGALLAALLAAPSIVWQGLHGWPFAQLVHNAALKDIAVGPASFLIGQVVAMNPLAAPVWLAGVVAPFVRADLRSLRAPSIAFLVALVATIAGHGKDYYVAAAYPTAFAIGAVALERTVVAWLRVVYVAALVAIAAVIAPTVLPYLNPDAVRGYFAALHATPPQEEKASLGSLPQYFADQFGWPELAALVAKVYADLPPADRAKAYVLGGNYGEAAAVDVYDAGLGLPPALSGHNQYGFWGPRGYDGSVLIDIGATVKEDLRACRSATLAATFTAPYVMPFEDHLGIVICRGLRQPVAKAWQRQRFMI